MPPCLSFLSFSVKGRYSDSSTGCESHSSPRYLYEINAPVSGETVADTLSLNHVYPSLSNFVPDGKSIFASYLELARSTKTAVEERHRIYI